MGKHEKQLHTDDAQLQRQMKKFLFFRQPVRQSRGKETMNAEPFPSLDVSFT